MIFKPDTVVCGSAIEVNCLTDIEVTINLDQVKLMSVLHNEMKRLLVKCRRDEDKFPQVNFPPLLAPRASLPMIRQGFKVKTTLSENDADFAKDSGIDFETSSLNSTIIVSEIITFQRLLSII